MVEKEAMYWTKKGGHIHCELCPKGCLIRPERNGLCQVRGNREGELRLLNYGLVSSLAIDPVEKKPLYHFYPGRKLLSLGSFGCNLECFFCQNWQISQGVVDTYYLSPEELLRQAMEYREKDEDVIGVAFTYNEPVVWYEYILDSSRLLKQEGFRVVLVSNGYICSQPLVELIPYVDAFNIDLKSFSNEYYVKIAKGTLDPVLTSIEEIAKAKKHVEVSTLVVPGLNDSIEEIYLLARWLKGLSPVIPLHLTRYYPEYKLDLPATPIESLNNLRQRAEKYLNYVYLGNVWETDTNTYCPSCSSKVIERHGYRVKVFEKEVCSVCQRKLDFVM